MAMFDFFSELAEIAAVMPVIDWMKKWLWHPGQRDGDLTINVMMIGGRRCGKTSVLASMQSCFEDVASQDTNLMLNTADSDTLDVIERKKHEMIMYFKSKGKKFFVPDSNPTLELTSYGFDLSLRDKKRNKLCINFIDYPGEWLSAKASKEDQERLAVLMKTSHIMIVAIDTPYMMEEDGQYGEFSNAYYRTTEMIKKSGFIDKESMILFVPLKCERYLNDKKIDLVQSKVCEVYKNLIQYIQYSGKCTAAITPILTLGGAAFSRFARNDDGEIIMREGTDIPDKAIYYFPDDKVTEPEPRFCEQPLFYTLAYTLHMAKAEKEKKKSGIEEAIQWLQTQFFKWPSAADYEKEFAKIRQKMKTSEDGYYVLNKSSWLKS